MTTMQLGVRHNLNQVLQQLLQVNCDSFFGHGVFS